MKKPRVTIWTFLFLFLAGTFASVIVYGMLTNDLSPRFGQYLIIEERTLPVEAAEGVSVRLELRALSEEPKLFVETERLPDSTPLRLWLVDVTGKARPLPLAATVKVNPQGKAEAEIELPRGAIRVYGWVIGEQNRKALFQAPLG